MCKGILITLSNKGMFFPSLSTTVGSNQEAISATNQGKHKNCSYHRCYTHSDDKCYTLQAKQAKSILMELQEAIKDYEIEEQHQYIDFNDLNSSNPSLVLMRCRTLIS